MSGARPLGTYYRVKYVGAVFRELAGSAFLYKEEKLTRLQEITERMKKVYIPVFGADRFHVIQSNAKLVEYVAAADWRRGRRECCWGFATAAVEGGFSCVTHSSLCLRSFPPSSPLSRRSELQPDHAYLQVSSLQPYFDEREVTARKTYFERNTSLKRFYFETPYTESGAPPHSADVSDQCKRKTVLEVALPFPYFKSRQPLDLPEMEVRMSAHSRFRLIFGFGLA